MLGGHGETEFGALARLGLHPDSAAVPLHNAPADGQADPGALELLAAVQPLEDLEDSTIEQIGDNGRTRLLHKPFKAAELIACVREAIDQVPSAARSPAPA